MIEFYSILSAVDYSMPNPLNAYVLRIYDL